MSYKTIVAKYCANRSGALTEIWSIIEGMGWQLHDNRDANSYRVYRSNGESGNEIYQYIRVDWGTANRIGTIGYYYWDNSNQIGTGASCNGTKLDTIVTAETGMYLWIYGDKNIVIIHTKVGATYYTTMWGFVTKKIFDTKTKLTQDATSGTNRTITVETTSGFVAGREYQIIGANAEGRDTVTVTSITNSTQMIIANLPRNYSVGSIIGENPCSFFAGLYDYSSYLFTTNPSNAVGTGNASSNDYYNVSRDNTMASSSTMVYYDPDQRGALRLLVPVNFLEIVGGQSRSFVGYTEGNIFYFPTTGMTVEDTIGVGQKDVGTATSGTPNTLTDSTKDWTTNEHQNKVVIITTGLGAGNIRKIAGNTATQITIEGADWNINNTSGYQIAEEAYRYITRSADVPLALREGV